MIEAIVPVLAAAMLTSATPVFDRDMKMTAPGDTEVAACNEARRRIRSRYEDRNTRVTRIGECECRPRRYGLDRVVDYVCEISFSYARRD